ncbi:hypothetical protein SAMN04488077_1203 [Roseovarius tolerans]|uniref:Uncharacterized protein n=1 Tax=Roseovarius tolerans TaxID=74031 RepID=A0A1H8HEM1_9RHOB|nr:helix-turn-helix domain-containing protein [Roseovarius tolerans]SEN53998.1 hypothetical protein SAMN04488077_1203 [Roseovarius tolerans]
MQVSDIDKQIAELQAQKRTIIEEEKKTAKKKVEQALQELNALGFNYKLVEEGTTPKRTRRTGVRDDVLKTIKNGDGMKPAEIAVAMGMDDAKGKQSISNALTALKKSGILVATDGAYTAK